MQTVRDLRRERGEHHWMGRRRQGVHAAVAWDGERGWRRLIQGQGSLHLQNPVILQFLACVFDHCINLVVVLP